MNPPLLGSNARHTVALDVEARLLAAEQVIVCGPRGIGKTSLARALQSSLSSRGTLCGYAQRTSVLGHVTRAGAEAYALDVDAVGLRRARARLLDLTEREPAVLLLDHVVAAPNAMRGFLRSLRGGQAGVAYLVDVDTDRDWQRLRRWRLSHIEVALPEVPRVTLRRRLVEGRQVDERSLAVLLDAARGRPGFITCCLERIDQSAYWHRTVLRASTLAIDAEIALRQRSSSIEIDGSRA